MNEDYTLARILDVPVFCIGREYTKLKGNLDPVISVILHKYRLYLGEGLIVSVIIFSPYYSERFNTYKYEMFIVDYKGNKNIYGKNLKEGEPYAGSESDMVEELNRLENIVGKYEYE